MVSVARAALLISAAGLALAAAPAGPVGAQSYPAYTGEWVYDVAGVIDDADEAGITRTFQTLEAQTGIDAVAVAIESVDGYDPRATIEDFATDLFNEWAIGDAGVDDGVLLLVAVGDREARVVIGDGFADAYVEDAQAVIDVMLPFFSDGDYSNGIEAGADEVASRFRSLGSITSGGTDSPGQPSGGGLADRIVNAVGEVQDSGGGIPDGVWYAVGGGGAALFGAGGFVTWQRIKPRKCLKCSREMRRLKGREAERTHLEPGQNTEEELDSVEYDVFECTSCGAHRTERHGKLFTRYKRCPACAYKAMSTARTTIVAATYDSGGRDRITRDCQHCDFHDEQEVSTPRKTRPSSTRSFSSGSRGSRSGPSGGGRSSGRGASGRW